MHVLPMCWWIKIDIKGQDVIELTLNVLSVIFAGDIPAQKPKSPRQTECAQNSGENWQYQSTKIRIPSELLCFHSAVVARFHDCVGAVSCAVLGFFRCKMKFVQLKKCVFCVNSSMICSSKRGTISGWRAGNGCWLRHSSKIPRP